MVDFAPLPVSDDRRGLLYELFTVAISPGRHIRVDQHGEHAYDESIPIPTTAPNCPHVVYLTHAGRFRLLVFDLDATKHGAQAVLDDLRLLRRWLDDAGIDHLVARSGPTGGRHVWVRVPDGVDAQLAVELAARLRGGGLVTLDSSLLHNPRRACARPPGALHRHGGHSDLDPAAHGNGTVLTAQNVRAAAKVFMRGTSAAVVRSLINLIPVPTPSTTDGHPPDTASADGNAAAPRSVRDRRVNIAVDKHGIPHLEGRRRPLSARMTTRLTEKPGRDNFGGHGYSALMHSVLVGAALSRWRFSDVLPWLEDHSMTAVEHCRSERRGDAHDRDPRTPERARKELRRAWEKAVLAAADLPVTVPMSLDEETRIGEVLATVAGIEDAAASVAWRWAGAAGPADQAALKAACYIAIRSRTLQFDLDCRRWAEMTGHGRSTMHRATRRLSDVDDDGRSWLRQVDRGDEGRAATWELLAQARDELPVDKSGTQREPCPPAACTRQTFENLQVLFAKDFVAYDVEELNLVNTETIVKNDLGGDVVGVQADLEMWLAHHSHDAWTYRRGLGHHVARVHWALRCGSRTVADVATSTGYSVRRVRFYLRGLHDHKLVWQGKQRVPPRDSLDRTARELGVLGTGATRARRHLIERTVHTWWAEEQKWRSSPKRARRSHHHDVAQRQLGVVDIKFRTRFGAFPTKTWPGVRGRANYQTATALVGVCIGSEPKSMTGPR